MGDDVIGNPTVVHLFVALIHVDRGVAVPEFLPAHGRLSLARAMLQRTLVVHKPKPDQRRTSGSRTLFNKLSDMLSANLNGR